MRVVVICVGSGRVHRELCDRSRHTCCVAADKNEIEDIRLSERELIRNSDTLFDWS